MNSSPVTTHYKREVRQGEIKLHILLPTFRLKRESQTLYYYILTQAAVYSPLLEGRGLVIPVAPIVKTPLKEKVGIVSRRLQMYSVNGVNDSLR